ncbi:hypothetical protein SJAG_05268 [Schizosaccharomyces japonicus yFS275]|uniref:Uncharacterized protein n=1 Tax=Schizosaccharomyces japonicus (strain yFS275 / FY16936) TaxID=402676 RepID=B6K2K5_SCHJY|nr:hypothetical protein SJAG_05268 [Schizosaccharomyces japonicus yFS275]EEB07386.1 hypothetical protein SJAG_05268 [Schizosaccharomyces japonicus yFS275]
MLPNLRRIFMLFRSEEEERAYSRRAFYNFIGFICSGIVFSWMIRKQRQLPAP